MSNGPSRELVSECVHCGFCLPTCPTYVLWGEEMDSPRGRIHLMRQTLEGAPLDATMIEHFDNCLGCMSCLTACPSGVEYDTLIESTRAQIEERGSRPRSQRVARAMVGAMFPHPRRLALARGPLRAYQRLGVARLVRRSGLLARVPAPRAAMDDLLPSLSRKPPIPVVTSPVGARRSRVGVLLGCVQREFFPGVNAATVRVLAAEGCEVIAPRQQGCCGALSLHIGSEAEAVERAKELISTFEAQAVDAVVVNVAGCGSSMKEFGRLLADDPDWADRAAAFSRKCKDVSELLIELGPAAPRHPVSSHGRAVVAAYHDACHLAHAQGVREAPRELLAGIPGLTIREIADADICCGSAGVYNVLNPEPARELGDRKAASVAATGAELVITGNPGCLMQIDSALRRQGRSIVLAHTIEVLDASIRGATITL